MKYIFELILTVIVVFFLWNFLKRIFFSAFYKFPAQKMKDEEVTQQKTKKTLDSRLNWDAETVDYEEVKEKRD